VPAGNKQFGASGGGCLVGHFAGFWKFCSRPSLTDTPACPKLLKRCTQARAQRTVTEILKDNNENNSINRFERSIKKKMMMKKILMIAAITGICLFFTISAYAQSSVLKPWPGKNTTMWGYIDGKGNFIVPPIYDYANGFSEGLALVIKYDKGILKSGYIDETGKEVIPCEYSEAKSFSEGLAAVKRGGFINKWGFIDKTGTEVIPLKYHYAGSFSEGLAVVAEEHYKYGYIDKTGTEVIPLKYDNADDFSGGVARVQLKNESFLIKKNGDNLKNIIQESSLLPHIKNINKYRSKLNPKRSNKTKSFQINRPYLAISTGLDTKTDIEKDMSILQYSSEVELNEKTINDVKTIIVTYPYSSYSSTYKNTSNSDSFKQEVYGEIIIYYDVDSKKCIGYDNFSGANSGSSVSYDKRFGMPNMSSYVSDSAIINAIKSHLAKSSASSK